MVLKIYVFFFCLLSGLWCSQSTTFKKPLASEESEINIPIKMSLSDLNLMVNHSTTDLLFQDDSFTDNNNDQLKLKVWKTRPIRLVSGTKQNFLIEVPIKIWAEKGIGTLGVYSYQNTSFETVMYFNAEILLNPNWTFSSKTQSNGYKWVQKPVLNFGAVKIPITTLVEKSLKNEQEKICKNIDQQISQSLNFQKNALDIWNSFQKPFLVNQDYSTWFRVSPKKITISPLQFYKDDLLTTAGITLVTETFVGEKPENNPILLNAPNFDVANVQPGKFNLITTAFIPITQAEEIARKQLLNQEYEFRGGKSKIKITDLHLKTELDRIAINVRLENGIDGEVFLSGIPKYHTEKKKIVLTDIVFKLKTKSFFQKIALALFKRKIINTIEQDYGIPMEGLENNAKASVENTFNHANYKGVAMNAKVHQILPYQIQLLENTIMVLINTNAMLNVTISNVNN